MHFFHFDLPFPWSFKFRTKVYILYLIIHLFNLVLTLDPFELLVT